jgi:hypothetical protein
MELRVESAEGTVLPKGCYVGVRVGDTLKQGRYEPNRSYHFPRVDRRRNAKIDVYQHVGSCVVGLDPDTKSTNLVKVEATNPSFAGMRLKVDVQHQNDAAARKQREARAAALRGQAQEYLQKHGIEERLAEAVKQVLQDQPSDPIRFICGLLQDNGSAAAPVKSAASLTAAADTVPEVPTPQEKAADAKPEPAEAQKQESAEDSEAVSLENLRQRTCDVLVKACEEGHMGKVLSQVRGEVQEDAGAAATAAPAPKVVLDRSKALQLEPMVPMSTMLGPGFASFGVCGGGFGAGCALFI